MTSPELESIGDGIWCAESSRPGPSVGISFGVHGNERPPIDAGLRLVEELVSRTVELERGRLLLLHSNPKATADNDRWSKGGVDLNRCFHASVLARDPELYEEQRAREIVAALERAETDVLIDFHCTVEPGSRFLLQHPPVSDEAHRRVYDLLRAEVLLADPDLNFGNVSLDEWLSTRGRVGICYETGWIHDPTNTADAVLEEMHNVLAGLELIAGVEPVKYDGKELLQLEHVVRCEEDGFAWRDGVGVNLQALPAGTALGDYASGRTVTLDMDCVLIFPKKRPELVKVGAPLVYVGVRR
jgi:predicted deacylase